MLADAQARAGLTRPTERVAYRTCLRSQARSEQRPGADTKGGRFASNDLLDVQQLVMKRMKGQVDLESLAELCSVFTPVTIPIEEIIAGGNADPSHVEAEFLVSFAGGTG
jgi:hypothetical protein